MDIHNTNEDMVFSTAQAIFEEIRKKGNPEGFCFCDQCCMDTICYALNRIEPHYIISNRGFTRIDQDGIKHQQNEADIVALVYKGLRLVSHNQRPTSRHDDSLKESADLSKPVFDTPTIVGRFIHGIKFDLITGISIELRSNGELVPMRNDNWQNPCTLIDSTPGAFSFWPGLVLADKTDIERVFEYTIKVDSPEYEPFNHFFKISVTSKFKAPFSYTNSLNRTYKLPDLYLFPPGEAEQNG